MQLLFSVTKKDFELQTFTVHGHGGGGKDTSNNGVRLIHRASGARGEGRDHRSMTRNREDAFRRLVNTKEFKNWHRIECARRRGVKIETPEEIRARVDREVDEAIRTGQIVIESLEMEKP